MDTVKVVELLDAMDALVGYLGQALAESPTDRETEVEAVALTVNGFRSRLVPEELNLVLQLDPRPQRGNGVLGSTDARC